MGVEILGQEVTRLLIDLFQVILTDILQLINDSLLEILIVGVIGLIEIFREPLRLKALLIVLRAQFFLIGCLDVLQDFLGHFPREVLDYVAIRVFLLEGLECLALFHAGICKPFDFLNHIAHHILKLLLELISVKCLHSLLALDKLLERVREYLLEVREHIIKCLRLYLCLLLISPLDVGHLPVDDALYVSPRDNLVLDLVVHGIAVLEELHDLPLHLCLLDLLQELEVEVFPNISVGLVNRICGVGGRLEEELHGTVSEVTITSRVVDEVDDIFEDLLDLELKLIKDTFCLNQKGGYLLLHW